MKPIRISRLKFSVLLVAVLALILTPALSAPADPAGEALIDAAKKGDAAKVNTLLAKGTDVNHQGEKGRTALVHAARKGHAAVVRILLAQGANIKHQDDKSRTALMHSARKGRVAVVKVLLAKGADVNHQTQAGGQPYLLHPRGGVRRW